MKNEKQFGVNKFSWDKNFGGVKNVGGQISWGGEMEWESEDLIYSRLGTFPAYLWEHFQPTFVL